MAKGNPKNDNELRERVCVGVKHDLEDALDHLRAISGADVEAFKETLEDVYKESVRVFAMDKASLPKRR